MNCDARVWMPRRPRFRPENGARASLVPRHPAWVVMLIAAKRLTDSSARAGEMEQIMAIESGADDYITKPFHYDVVMAKIKGQLRRIYGDYAPNISERIVEVEGLKLFPERPEIHFGSEQVLLTKKEAILAEMLLSKFPRTASREDLLAALWDDESFVEENTLNVNITRLRKKFNELGIENSIETVRGLGYRFNATWSE